MAIIRLIDSMLTARRAADAMNARAVDIANERIAERVAMRAAGYTEAQIDAYAPNIRPSDLLAMWATN